MILQGIDKYYAGKYPTGFSGKFLQMSDVFGATNVSLWFVENLSQEGAALHYVFGEICLAMNKKDEAELHHRISLTYRLSRLGSEHKQSVESIAKCKEIKLANCDDLVTKSSSNYNTFSAALKNNTLKVEELDPSMR